MFGKLGYQAYKATENGLSALSNAVENISNINSLGYKKNRSTFVETLNGEIAKYESRDFSQGPLRKTGEVYDLALDGPGFFEVELPSGQRAYTRAGRFKLTSEGELITEEGYRVIPEIEQKGAPTVKVSKNEKNELGMNIEVSTPKLAISTNLVPEVLDDGTVNGINTGSGEKVKIGKINVVAFNNVQGLESTGRGYFSPTKSSGPALDIDAGLNGTTKVKQGYLELGNTDMANEFMNLSQLKSLLSAEFKVLKVIDKIYEQVHYSISKSV